MVKINILNFLKKYWIYIAILIYILIVQDMPYHENSSIIIIWLNIVLLICSTIIYSILAIKSKKNSLYRANWIVFVVLFSFLFVLQNYQLYAESISHFLIIFLFIIIFLYSTYLLLKLPKVSKNFLTTWWIIIFTYIFILSSPQVPYVQPDIFSYNNWNEIMSFRYSETDAVENKYCKTDKNEYIIQNSNINKRLNIPLIINFSIIENYKKAYLYSILIYDTLPSVYLPVPSKELFTNYYVKNIIDSFLKEDKATKINFLKNIDIRCFPIKTTL